MRLWERHRARPAGHKVPRNRCRRCRTQPAHGPPPALILIRFMEIPPLY